MTACINICNGVNITSSYGFFIREGKFFSIKFNGFRSIV